MTEQPSPPPGRALEPAADRSALRRLATFRDPVVPILILAGVFDWLSGNAIHSLLLFAVAVALVRDAAVSNTRNDIRRTSTRGFPAPPPWLLVMVGLLYAVLIGEFGRYSWPATVAVIAPAGAGLVFAWHRPLRPARTPRPIRPAARAGALAWAGLFITLGLWELSALLLQPTLTTDSYAHPTISVLTDPVLATHLGRSIALFAWLATGWFLVEA